MATQEMIDDVEAFLTDLQLQGCRSVTIRNNRWQLYRFFRFTGAGKPSAKTVAVDDVRRFLLMYQKKANSSYWIMFHCLKRFFKFLNPEVWMFMDRLKVKLEEKPVEPFTLKEIYAIMEELEKRQPRTRYKQGMEKVFAVIGWILASTGARIGEVCSLNFGQLETVRDEGVIFYRLTFLKETTKTKKERRVYFKTSSITGIALRRYLEIRGAIKPDEPLFLNALGCRLRPMQVEAKFARASKKLGFKKKSTPHVLRHSLRQLLKKKKVDDRTAADILGHDVQTLRRIYTFTSEHDKMDVARDLPF